MSKKPEPERPSEDEVLRRMLNTPPKPRVKPPAPGKKPQSRLLLSAESHNRGMDTKAHSALTAAHTAWELANRQVREKERVLAAALSAYESQQGPLPSELMAEVHAMRIDCNAKFQVLMAAMRGDSSE